MRRGGNPEPTVLGHFASEQDCFDRGGRQVLVRAGSGLFAPCVFFAQYETGPLRGLVDRTVAGWGQVIQRAWTRLFASTNSAR